MLEVGEYGSASQSHSPVSRMLQSRVGPLPHHIAAFLEAPLNESKLKIVSERVVHVKH